MITHDSTNRPSLRSCAEEVMRKNAYETTDMLPSADKDKLLHELQVHQIELEMQNDELQIAFSELSEHKLHLENIIKMTPAGYFQLDIEGRILDVNEAWLRIHRYDSKDEVIGKHFRDVEITNLPL